MSETLLRRDSMNADETTEKTHAEQMCVEANRVLDIEEEIDVSPSGKYVLKISKYTTGKGTWGYTKGSIRSKRNGDLASVCRNYSSFPFCWVENEEGDFLICGSDYQGLTVVNLKTGEVVNWKPGLAKIGSGFCHVSFSDSPDGKLLATEGCIWGGPYEVKIYSIENIMSLPWKLVSTELRAENFFKWTSNTSCEVGGWQDNICIPLGRRESEMTSEEMDKYCDVSDEEWDTVWKDNYRDYATWTLRDEIEEA